MVVGDFNNGIGAGRPERNRFPVVADPNGTEVNQVWLNYAWSEDIGIKLGRQRILLDESTLRRRCGKNTGRKIQDRHDSKVPEAYKSLTISHAHIHEPGNYRKMPECHRYHQISRIPGIPSLGQHRLVYFDLLRTS